MLFNSPQSDAAAFKVCICGQQGVGKTALLNRRITGNFTNDYRPTIAAAFATVTETVHNKPVILNVWDTAGQEKYQSMMPLYFRNVACMILVMDVSDPNSWDFIRRWTETELVSIIPKPTVVVCLNKSDLKSAVDIPAIAEWASQASYPIYHTSAFTGVNVNEVFRKVATILFDNDAGYAGGPGVQLQQNNGKKSCC